MTAIALSKREKNLIVLAVSFGITAILITYVLLPYWDKLVQVRNDLEAKETALSLIRKVTQNEAALDRKIAELTASLDSLRRRLPVSPETAELLYYINKAAGETSVSLEEMETGKGNESVEANLASLAVKITITGTYAQTRAFLEKTENLQRINNLTKVEIRAEHPDRLRTILFLDVYQFKKGHEGLENGSDVPPPASVTKSDPFI